MKKVQEIQKEDVHFFGNYLDYKLIHPSTPAIIFAQKKSHLRLHFLYGWGTWIRTKEMPDSESGALPLGYTPISATPIF